MKENIDEKALFNVIKEYLNARKELALLTVVDKASHFISAIIAGIIISIFIIFSLLFLSIAVGILISDKIGSVYAGFFIVAGFYIVTTVLLVLLKKNSIKKPLIDVLIKQFLKERNQALYEDKN